MLWENVSSGNILAASTESLPLHKYLIFHFSKEGNFLLIFLESTEMYLGIHCLFKTQRLKKIITTSFSSINTTTVTTMFLLNRCFG